jgi:co-chaperonin GroES (HSP10)
MSMIDNVCGHAQYALVRDVGEHKDRTNGGIYIPDTAQKPTWHEVLSVGPNMKAGYTAKDGTVKPLAPGDRIQFHQGVKVAIDGKDYIAVPENNIMLVLPKESL